MENTYLNLLEKSNLGKLLKTIDKKIDDDNKKSINRTKIKFEIQYKVSNSAPQYTYEYINVINKIYINDLNRIKKNYRRAKKNLNEHIEKTIISLWFRNNDWPIEIVQKYLKYFDSFSLYSHNMPEFHYFKFVSNPDKWLYYKNTVKYRKLSGLEFAVKHNITYMIKYYLENQNIFSSHSYIDIILWAIKYSVLFDPIPLLVKYLGAPSFYDINETIEKQQKYLIRKQRYKEKYRSYRKLVKVIKYFNELNVNFINKLKQNNIILDYTKFKLKEYLELKI